MSIMNKYQLVDHHLVMQLLSLSVSIINSYSDYHNFHAIAKGPKHI
jgi:hypothetical protein